MSTSSMLYLSLIFFLGIATWLATKFLSSDFLQKGAAMATIIAMLLGVVVLAQFFFETNNKRVSSVIDQLAFFRTEILPLGEKNINVLQAQNGDLNLIRVGLIKDFNYYWVRQNYQASFLQQEKLMKANKDLHANTVAMFNAMEQFSWSVILSDTIKHEALFAVRDAYVQLIELFAYTMMYMREDQPNLYKGISTIYNQWAPEVLHETPETKSQRISEKMRSLKMQYEKSKN